MIETIENTLQLVVSGFCMIYSYWHASVSQHRLWLLIGSFFLLYFLGELYWVLYLALYTEVDALTFIPDLSWANSYFFLLLTLLSIRKETPKVRPSPFLWLIPVFTGGMCVFYLQWGAVVSNLVTFLLMTLIFWYAFDGLHAVHKLKDAARQTKKWLYIVIIGFCGLEYALWTASCFTSRNDLLSPYIWIDILMSVLFVFFLPATRKAVGP